MMFGFSKKKDKGTNKDTDPPLPEQLPPMPDNLEQQGQQPIPPKSLLQKQQVQTEQTQKPEIPPIQSNDPFPHLPQRRPGEGRASNTPPLVKDMPEDIPDLPSEPAMPTNASNSQFFPNVKAGTDSMPSAPAMPESRDTLGNRPDKLVKDSKLKMPSSPNQGLFPEAPGDTGKASNIHDQIPDDIGLSNMKPISSGEITPRSTNKPKNSAKQDIFAPENLPEIDEEAEATKAADFGDAIPKQVSSENLPPLPKVPEVREQEPIVAGSRIARIKKPSKETPVPEMDEDVPRPPPIFAEDSFYETPEEVQHLVGKKKGKPGKKDKDYIDKYHLDDMDVPSSSKEPFEKIEFKKYNKSEGPIFVDIEAFKTLLGDIDSIKNDIKASTEILQHLNEIKNSKDEEFEKWRVSLEDMQRKINYIDKLVFKEA